MKLVNIISQIGGDSKQFQGDSRSSPEISFSQLLAKQLPETVSGGIKSITPEQILPEIDGLMEKIGRHTQTPEFLKQLAVQWNSVPGEKAAIVNEYTQEQLLNFVKNLQTTEFSVQQLANPESGLAAIPSSHHQPVTDVLAHKLHSSTVTKNDGVDKTFADHSSNTKEHLSYLKNHTALTPAIQISLQQGEESRPAPSFEEVRLTQFLQGLPENKSDSDTLAKSLRQWIESAQPEGKPFVNNGAAETTKPVFDDQELLQFAKNNGINPDVAATILTTTQTPSLESQANNQPAKNYPQSTALLGDDTLIALSDTTNQALKDRSHSNISDTTPLGQRILNESQQINSGVLAMDLTQDSTTKSSSTTAASLHPKVMAKATPGMVETAKPAATQPSLVQPEVMAKATPGTVETVKPATTQPSSPVQPEVMAKATQGTVETAKPATTQPSPVQPEVIAKATTQETLESVKQLGVLNPPKTQTLVQNNVPKTDLKGSNPAVTNHSSHLKESVDVVVTKTTPAIMDELKKFNNPYASQLVGKNLSLKQKTNDQTFKSTAKGNGEIISTSTFIENRSKLRDVAINTAVTSTVLLNNNEIKPTPQKATDDSIALQLTTTSEHGEEKIKETEVRRAGDLTRFNLITARNQQHLQSQMSERITQMLRAGQWSADMKLNPENLGPIKINMVMDKDQLKVMFISQHNNVRELVESSIPRLRDSLAESGINLADTSVGRDAQQKQQQEHSNEEQFNFQTKIADNNSEELTEEKQRSTHDGDLDTFV